MTMMFHHFFYVLLLWNMVVYFKVSDAHTNCDGLNRNTGSMKRCQEYTAIKITSATFGRSSKSECDCLREQTEPTICGNTDCKLDVKAIMEGACNGKQTCNYVVTFDDPCPGFSKYLEVNYNCPAVKPPAPTLSMNQTQAYTGDVVQLTCTKSTSDQRAVTYAFSPLTQVNTASSSTSSTASIRQMKVADSDSGTYNCRVSAGSITSGWSGGIEFEVLTLADKTPMLEEIYGRPTNVSYHEGITLVCNTTLTAANNSGTIQGIFYVNSFDNETVTSSSDSMWFGGGNESHQANFSCQLNHSCISDQCLGMSLTSNKLLVDFYDPSSCDRCDPHGTQLCWHASWDNNTCDCFEGYKDENCSTIDILDKVRNLNVSSPDGYDDVFDILGKTQKFTSTIIKGIVKVDRHKVTAVVLTNLTVDLLEVPCSVDKSMDNIVLEMLGMMLEAFRDIGNNTNCPESQEIELCSADEATTQSALMETAVMKLCAYNLTCTNDSTTVFNTLKYEDTTLDCFRDISDLHVIPTTGALVTLPQGLLGDGYNNIMALTFEHDETVSTTELRPDHSSNVFRIQVTDAATREPLPLSASQPLQLAINPLTTFTSPGNTTNRGYNISLLDLTSNNTVAGISVLFLEFTYTEEETLTIMGKVDGLPYTHTAQFIVTASDAIGVKVTRNDLDLNAFMHPGDDETLGELTVSSHSLVSLGNFLLVSAVYESSELHQNETVNITREVRVYTMMPTIWDNEALGWVLPQKGIQQTSSGSDKRLAFKSDFFGTFAINRMVIAPESIDWEDIILNFSEYLTDSPYVLVLISVSLLTSVLMVVYLRRLDKRDQCLWCYLPLVDDDVTEPWAYTVSVHTSCDSPGQMTSLPYFVMKGIHGRTYVRILADGKRQNFGSGSVCNFVFRSQVWLGELLSIKIWTNGKGAQPDWKLERLVVMDIRCSEKYLFVCQDWLAVSRGDGILCREIPVYDVTSFFAGRKAGGGVGLVSKESLYKDHLWLSIAKRPAYSSFTRVQRFLVAVALLYLSMVSNAMFYTGGQDATQGVTQGVTQDITQDTTQDTTQTDGITFGKITIGYRDFYVGVMSGVLIAIPGLLMTWLFTHRRLKGVQYEVDTPLSTTGYLDNVDIFSNAQGKKNELSIPAKLNDDNSFVLRDFLSEVKEGAEKYLRVQEEIGRLAEHKKKTGRLLPWGAVIAAYAIAFAAILASATVVLFYSLQWGGETSLQWMLSIFFSTSTSTFFMEPLKIVLLATLISCLLSKAAMSDLYVVAPYHDMEAVPPRLSPPLPLMMEPPNYTSELKAKKIELKMTSRFYDVIRSIAIKLMSVLVVGVLCLHTDNTQVYRQNTHLMGLTKAKWTLQTSDDIYTWLKDVLIINVFPTSALNGTALTSYERHFLTDGMNYRLGPVRLVQFRVNTNCDKYSSIPGTPNELMGIHCVQHYTDYSREDASFGPKWERCSESCFNAAFQFWASDEHSLMKDGDHAWYGPSGYQAVLGDTFADCMANIDTLNTSNWIDPWTRGVLVEFTVFNANTELFTQTHVLLELPSVGGVTNKTFSESAVLYPYVTAWDYGVLLLQLAYSIVVFGRWVVFVYRLCCNSISSDILVSLATGSELMFSLTAIVAFVVKSVKTPGIVERIVNETDVFTSLDVLTLLNQVYILCLSVVLSVRILYCLAPLSLNFHLWLMRRTIAAAVAQLLGFMVLLLSALVAFSCYFNLAKGATSASLKSVPRAFSTLTTVLLGHGKYRNMGDGDDFGTLYGTDFLVRLMYGIFCFAVAIVMINIAVTILTSYMENVKLAQEAKEGRRGKCKKEDQHFDQDFNDFVWVKMDNIIRKMFSMSTKTMPVHHVKHKKWWME